MSYRPPPTSPEFQCYGFVALFLLSGGLIYFVHSKERTKQENNIDIWGKGGCSMYKGLNNSSIYGSAIMCQICIHIGISLIICNNNI